MERLATATLVLFMSTPVWAQEAVIRAPATPPRYGSLLLKTALSVAIVCVLAFVALKYGLKRIVGVGGADDRVRVLARYPIEPRRTLLVVRVVGKTLLLSSSEAGVHLVHALEEEDALAFLDAPILDDQPDASFSLEAGDGD